MDGLDTIVIDETGQTILHRARPPGWEMAEFQITAESVGKVCSLVESHGMLSLQGGYHADVCDGTQWVFWMKQGQDYRSVYFNNYFPDKARSFAAGLDTLLEKNGLSAVKWTPVPEGEWRQHEKAIWNSIQAKPFASPPPQVIKLPTKLSDQ
jgi:hypothetical protein